MVFEIKVSVKGYGILPKLRFVSPNRVGEQVGPDRVMPGAYPKQIGSRSGKATKDAGRKTGKRI